MILSPMVRRVVAGEGLDEAEVIEWVRKAARFSHEFGNRRYHEWIFEVRGEQVLRMVTLDPVEQFEHSMSPMVAYELCEECNGDGCKACGWHGEVKVIYGPME